jgi:GAF domain-containing protein
MGDTMRIEGAEQRIARLETQIALWHTELDRCETRESVLREQVEQLQQENRRLAEREVAAEQRVGQLAQLVASTLQLHAASLPGHVLTVIKEIVANLLGSEDMAVYARRADGSLALLGGIGDDLAARAATPAFTEVLHSGTVRIAGESPVACVPLRVEGRVLGVLAIFALLPQKRAFETSDRELLELLADHAGVALHHAELRASA